VFDNLEYVYDNDVAGGGGDRTKASLG